MKKSVLIAMMFFIATTAYTQKKTGTVYNEHPAIAIVEAMQQAFIKGDVDLLNSYLSDDFKEWDGSSTNKNDKGTDKEQFMKNATWWSENMSYLSIKRQGQAYPDAIKYKDDDDGLWVQTWDIMKGVHTKTGSKINMPIHRLFAINKDNKIETMISYYNDEVFANIGRSFDVRENGVIYDNHEYINAVKMAFAAFENGDLETAYSYFADDARFRNSSMLPGDKSATLDAIKERNIGFLDTFEVVSIDMNGYPDYLHYERGDMDLVQSWWTFRLIRKSDNKKIVVPAFYTHTFNKEGKIISGTSYINEKLFEE